MPTTLLRERKSEGRTVANGKSSIDREEKVDKRREGISPR